MLLADINSFKSGKKLSINIPKGQSAEINFPAKPQVINFSGRMYCRNQDYSIEKNNEWFMMHDTTQCAAVKVYSCHEAALFVGGDDCLWGLGYRSQGSGTENCKLFKIETPGDCRNFKKIAHGKFFRVVLTQEGKVFFNGQNRKYMYRSSMDRNAHTRHFFEINDYYRLEENERIVDITAGKHYTAIVTDRGRIKCGGYIFYRYFSDCRYNPEQNEDYEFELRLPDDYKAKEVFGCERYNNLWVTAEKDGVLKTFGAGSSTDLTGHNSSSQVSRFHALELPDGTYMTKISCQGYVAVGIDNHQQLWIWGEHFGKDSSDDCSTLYEGDMGYRSKPMKVKYFTDNNLKVLDCASGYYNALVKVKNE